MTRDRVKASDELYAEIAHVPCPECGAGEDEYCSNSRHETGRRAHAPCHRRISAAKHGTSTGAEQSGNAPHSSAPATGRPV
jgi:hypothetical protein